MKIEFSKEIRNIEEQTEEILTMNNLINQIKTSVKSFINIMGHREDRISGCEDAAEEMGHLVKANDKFKNTYESNTDIWNTRKRLKS